MTEADAAGTRPAASGVDAYIVRLGSSSTDVLGRLSAAGHARPLVALAETLAASPPVGTMPEVVLGVWEAPEPMLVLAGCVDAAAKARLEELVGLLDEAGPRLRFFSWTDVEHGCVLLAGHLRGLLGEEGLARAALLGVPRGGSIVAGLLAYTLGVPRQRVGSIEEAETVIVVDDCSLSGVRLHRVLAGLTGASRIVIATLTSHPDLRAAVCAAEPRVEGFVSGSDLHDHGPDLLGDGDAPWRQRWDQRVPQRYHTALLDLLVFPWSEPEVRMWNPVTEQVEPHWWLAPPASCLHHRMAPRAIEVQLVDDHPARRHLAAGTIPLELDAALALVDTSTGNAVQLPGTARALWDAWVATGDVRSAATAIAEDHDVSTDRAAADLRGLLEELAARGLLAGTTTA